MERIAEQGFFQSLCYDSTIQGFRFIGSPKLHFLERVFWVIIVILSLIYSSYLIYDLYIKYRAIPVIISFQPDETSIEQIPFPAITLCNVNIFKTSVFGKTYYDFITAFTYSKNRTNDVELFKFSYVFENLVQFCLTTPSFRRKTEDLLCDGLGYPDVIKNLHQHYLNHNESHIPMTSFLESLKHFKTAIKKFQQKYSEGVQSCDDMILRCSWSGSEIPCKETFFPLDTREGSCCVFNMMPIFLIQNISAPTLKAILEGRTLPEEAIEAWKAFTASDIVQKKGHVSSSKYPRRQVRGGKNYGLSIVVNPDIAEYSTCTTNDAHGFTMDAHSPLTMPSNREFGTAIPINSEVFVELEPLVTDADYEVMNSIKVESRECYTSADTESKLKHYKYYTIENCISECIADAQFETCLCVQHHLPQKKSTPCNSKQRGCAETVIANLLRGDEQNCDHCRPPCTEIDYKMSAHTFDLRQETLDTPFKYKGPDGETKNASNYSIIHIYFATDTLNIKERKVLYSVGDFVADAGGLLGFTIGITIVSFLEFLYFFTLRFYMYSKSFQKGKGSTNKGQSEIRSKSQSNRLTLSFQAKIVPNPLTRKQNSGRTIYPFLR